MKYLTPVLLTLLTLACSQTTTLAGYGDLHPSTPVATVAVETAQVGRVVVDALTVRVGPGEQYPAYDKHPYLVEGEAVMVSGCIRFANGDVWGALGDEYIAVIYRNERFVEGVCQ